MSAALKAPGIALTAAGLIALRHAPQGVDSAPSLSALTGGFVTKRRGHGQEIAEVREYVAGDDIRHVDRGSTARTGRLHVRSFQEERDRITLLVADFRPSMLWGTQRVFRSVAAAEVLALIGWRVIEQGGRVGLYALGAGAPVVVPARGRARGMLAVIGGMVRAHDAALQLALAGQREDPALDTFLSHVQRIAPSGAEIALASGFDTPGEGLTVELGQLARSCLPSLFAIEDGGITRLAPGTYPIRLADGSRTKAVVSEIRPTLPETVTIAGQTALVIDTAVPLTKTAQRIAALYSQDKGR